jgi:hypothetical protein
MITHLGKYESVIQGKSREHGTPNDVVLFLLNDE